MKVWELLSEPEKWHQGHQAADKAGKPCAITDPAAVCYCLSGGLAKCYLGGFPVESPTKEQSTAWSEAVETILAEVNRRRPEGTPEYKCLWFWNDAKERTYEEVLEVLMDVDR